MTTTAVVYCPAGHDVEVTAHEDGDLDVSGRWAADPEPEGDGWAVSCPDPACEWAPAFHVRPDLTTL